MMWCALIYTSAALFGYMICGEDTPELITQIPNIKPGRINYLINLAVGILIVNLFFAIPLIIPAGRNMTMEIFKIPLDNRPVAIGISIFYQVLLLILAAFFRSVINLLSILGGFCGCFVVIFFPGISYAILNWHKNRTTALFVASYSLFFTMIGLINAIIIVYQTIAGTS